MSSRGAASTSIVIHGLAIWALSMIAISPAPEKITAPGMEFELIDLEHAMPLPAPVAPSGGEVLDTPSLDQEVEPVQTVTQAKNPQTPALLEKPPSQPMPTKEATPVEKPQLAPSIVAPKVSPVSEVVPASAKVTSATPVEATAKSVQVANAPSRPRLNALALSKAIASKGAPAPTSRINSAAIGSAIGKAAPRGAASLTFRQRANLEDMIRSQVTPCWNPPSLDDRAGQLSVVMRIRLEKSGALSSPPVVVAVKGQTELNTAYTKSLAASVRRAVISCSPLRLPSELYDAWADVELVFDPRDIL